MAKITLGKVGITLGGVYDATQTYDKLVCVTHDGRSWVSRTAVPAGAVPSETTHRFWQLVSERGEQGPQGIQGPIGMVGPRGLQGNSGYTGAADELEVVNNLETSNARAALSAKMGMELGIEVTRLSQKVENLAAGGGGGGGVGIYDAEVSVDDTTGTPEANVTLEGGILNFSFSGLKGERGADGAKGEKGDKGDQGEQGLQGNSGYTGTAGELEVVNNLTDGGATAALSAEQGKVLAGQIAELKGLPTEETIGEDMIVENKYISASGKNVFGITSAITDYSGAYATEPITLKKGDALSIPVPEGWYKEGIVFAESAEEDGAEVLTPFLHSLVWLQQAVLVATRDMNVRVGLGNSSNKGKLQKVNRYATNLQPVESVQLYEGYYDTSATGIYSSKKAQRTDIFTINDRLVFESKGSIGVRAVFFKEDGSIAGKWGYNSRQCTTDLIAYYPDAVGMAVNFFNGTDANAWITAADVSQDISIYRISDDKASEGGSDGAFIKIRVGAWNVGNFSKGGSFSTISSDNYLAERGLFRKALNEMAADILCISEFESIFNTTTSEKADDAIFPQYPYNVQGSLDLWNGYVGQKIYSMVKNGQFSQIPLSETADHYLLEAEFVINGKRVIVGCVHIDWSDEAEHNAQIAALVAHYEGNDADAIIIGGDYNHNAAYVDADVATLEAAGFSLANHGYIGNITTFPSGTEGEQALDNIIVKGCKILHIGTIETSASDHYPIYCDIVIS